MLNKYIITTVAYSFVFVLVLSINSVQACILPSANCKTCIPNSLTDCLVCNDKFFNNASTRKCEACSSNCNICSSGNNCVQCASDYTLQSNMTCTTQGASTGLIVFMVITGILALAAAIFLTYYCLIRKEKSEPHTGN